MPVLSAVVATEQLRTLPHRMAAAEANLATLREILTILKAPVSWPAIDEGSIRGWYGTPLIITQPIPDPHTLRQRLTTAGVPLRQMYEDWAQTPLLQHPELAARYWPHLTHTPYIPPTEEALPNFYRAYRQMLIVKIPHISAPDYMEQVAHTMASALRHTIGA